MKPFHSLANDNTAFFPARPADIGQATPGRIFALANSAYDQSALSQSLTTYATGVQDDQSLEELLNAIAPQVVVGGESFQYLVHNDKGAFMDDYADEGDQIAPGTLDIPRVKSNGTRLDGSVDIKGLSVVLLNSRGGENSVIQQMWVRHLKDRLMRTEVRRALAALDAIATDDAQNWNAADMDPDYDVMEDLDTGGDARGVDGNVVVFGGGAWLKRFRALRNTDNAAKFATAGFTPGQLAEMYGVDKVVKAKARRQNTATAKEQIIGSKVYTLYSSQSPSTEDPSNLKRFVLAMEGGTMPVYIEQHKLLATVITVMHQSRIVTTSNLGVRTRTVTFS